MTAGLAKAHGQPGRSGWRWRQSDGDRIRCCSWGCPSPEAKHGRSVGRRGRGSFLGSGLGERRAAEGRRNTRRRDWRWDDQLQLRGLYVCMNGKALLPVWACLGQSVVVFQLFPRERSGRGSVQHSALPCLALGLPGLGPVVSCSGSCPSWFFLPSPQPARKIVELTKSDTPPRPGSCTLQGFGPDLG